MHVVHNEGSRPIKLWTEQIEDGAMQQLRNIDAAVLDEIPGAYKDIDEVMERQRDLVEVLHTLKQVLCVKGT